MTGGSGGVVRVLGIDPGLSRCGYGVVESTASGLAAVESGLIETPRGRAAPERLLCMAEALDRLVARVAPAAVAVERVLFQANARTAMAVGQASGLALLAAARAGVPVAEYSPNEVKLAVVGYGGAGKAQVQAMVRSLLGLSDDPEPADVADALALALCHLATVRTRDRLGRRGNAGPVPALERAIEAALVREAGA